MPGDLDKALAAAIAGLSERGPDARRAIYDKMRTALQAEVRNSNPIMPINAVIARRRELEYAIANFERDAARREAKAVPTTDAVVDLPSNDSSAHSRASGNPEPLAHAPATFGSPLSRGRAEDDSPATPAASETHSREQADEAPPLVATPPVAEAAASEPPAVTEAGSPPFASVVPELPAAGHPEDALEKAVPTASADIDPSASAAHATVKSFTDLWPHTKPAPDAKLFAAPSLSPAPKSTAKEDLCADSDEAPALAQPESMRPTAVEQHVESVSDIEAPLPEVAHIKPMAGEASRHALQDAAAPAPRRRRWFGLLALALLVLLAGIGAALIGLQLDRARSVASAPMAAPRAIARPVLTSAPELFRDAGFQNAARDAFTRGNSLLANGDYDRAASAYDDAIRLDPGIAAAYGNRAFAHWSSGRIELAIRDYGSAIERDGGNFANRLNRAIAYNRIGQYQRAIADLDAVVAAEPANVSALNSRCWARALLGRLDEALADCNEAVRRDAKNADALDSRGFVHLRAGRLDRAVADYSAALKLDAKLAGSLYGRGLAKIGRGDRAGGNEDVAAARALDPAIQTTFASYGVK
jgi:tetratricopeptide (TPR) repeat protein